MNRCGDCIWFAPKNKKGVRGKCVCTDADIMITDKRCKDNFEKKKYDRRRIK